MNGQSQKIDTDALRIPSHLIAHINVKLALIGCSPVPLKGDQEFIEITVPWRRSRGKRTGCSAIIFARRTPHSEFLYDYLQDMPVPKLPTRTFTLDRPGLARVLSLPLDRDEFASDIISSYRVKQGVLHNPKATGAPRRASFTWRRAGCRFRTTSWACPRSCSRGCWQHGAHTAGGNAAAAVHRHPTAAGGMFCFTVAAATGVPGSPRDSLRTRRWKCASSCRATW